MSRSEGCSRSGGQPFALVWSPIPLISWLMPFVGHIGVCSSTGRTYDFAGPFTVNEDRLLFGRPTRYLCLSLAQATRGPGRRMDSGPPNGATAAGPWCHNTAADGAATAAAAEDAAEAGLGAGMGSAGPASRSTGLYCSGGLHYEGSHTEMWLDGGDGAGKAAASTSRALTVAAVAPSASAAAAAHSWDHRLCFAATTYRLLNYNIMTNNCHCFVAHFLNQVGYRGGGWDMVNLAALMFVHGRYTCLAGVVHTWLPWLLMVGLGGYFGRLQFLLAYGLACAPLLAWFLTYSWCYWRDLSF